MAEETAVKTQVRRGVATARGTQRMKFSNDHQQPNGLFLGSLESVVVSKINISESSVGMPSFNGMEIPRLTLTFTDTTKQHFTTLSFTAVESNVDTIPGGKSEWKVNTIFDWMKHLLNVYYLKGNELTEEQANALALTFNDVDEQGQYEPVKAEDVVAAYTTLFENFANMMNTAKDGKPVYLDKDGKPVIVWIKLIRYIKNKKGWGAVTNGDLTFPTFVGEGCVEIFKQGVKPAIRIDSIREKTVPMELKEDKQQPNVMGQIPGAMPAGMIDPTNVGSLVGEAGTDMPF